MTSRGKDERLVEKDSAGGGGGNGQGKGMEETAAIDKICDLFGKTTIPGSVTNTRSMPLVLKDNLFVC